MTFEKNVSEIGINILNNKHKAEADGKVFFLQVQQSIAQAEILT